VRSLIALYSFVSLRIYLFLQFYYFVSLSFSLSANFLFVCVYVSMYWYGLASFQKFLLWFSVAECAGAVSSEAEVLADERSCFGSTGKRHPTSPVAYNLVFVYLIDT